MITCTFEHGGTTHLRHITVDAIVIDHDKILLVKRAQKLTQGGKWALPGGYLNMNEDTIEGIKREVSEETGYNVTSLQFFKFVDTPKRKNVLRQDVTFVYIVQVGDIASDSDYEVEEQKWFALNDLPSVKEMAFDHGEIIQDYMSTL